MLTAQQQGFSHAGRPFFHGGRPFTHGIPVDLVPVQKPLTPERIIVRAARAAGMPAYAVFQPGGQPVLPSVVFQSVSANELTTFDRKLEVQDLLVEVRAKTYQEVIDMTDAMYRELKSIAGARYDGMSGQWADSYAPNFEFRIRTFAVTIRR